MRLRRLGESGGVEDCRKLRHEAPFVFDLAGSSYRNGTDADGRFGSSGPTAIAYYVVQYLSTCTCRCRAECRQFTVLTEKVLTIMCTCNNVDLAVISKAGMHL